jgi:parallel beta-helix repeat protein
MKKAAKTSSHRGARRRNAGAPTAKVFWLFFAKKNYFPFFALALAYAPPSSARVVAVTGTESLSRAIAQAQPGDDIVLADGNYKLTRHLSANAAGTPQAPITVRAAHHWQAHILSTALVAFEVAGPHWIFRDLDVQGVCATDTACEHAFHVVGTARGFQLLDNRLVDFNAQLKVNADTQHTLPTGGLVAGNEIFDTHARHTDNPVAPLDMDNASFWVARDNLIYDFQKDGGNEVAYGAYFKGGSVAPVFEHNLVLCSRFVPPVGQTVGLSLGAGGMDPKLCPPHWDAAQDCNPEVLHGVARNNIVASCSDDGIYLNNASQSKVRSNTLIDTKGIEFRFAGSSGEARGNELTGTISTRDQAQIIDVNNYVKQPRDRWKCLMWLNQKLDMATLMSTTASCTENK